jgi:hypothetical protein
MAGLTPALILLQKDLECRGYRFSRNSLNFRAEAFVLGKRLRQFKSTFESVRIDALARRFRPANEGLRLSSRF